MKVKLPRQSHNDSRRSLARQTDDLINALLEKSEEGLTADHIRKAIRVGEVSHAEAQRMVERKFSRELADWMNVPFWLACCGADASRGGYPGNERIPGPFMLRMEDAAFRKVLAECSLRDFPEKFHEANALTRIEVARHANRSTDDFLVPIRLGAPIVARLEESFLYYSGAVTWAWAFYGVWLGYGSFIMERCDLRSDWPATQQRLVEIQGRKMELVQDKIRKVYGKVDEKEKEVEEALSGLRARDLDDAEALLDAFHERYFAPHVVAEFRAESSLGKDEG